MSGDRPVVNAGGFVADTINGGVSTPSNLVSGDSDKRNDAYGQLATGGIFPGAKGLFNFSFGPDKSNPKAPPAPPTLGQANIVGLQGQLSHEQRMASASTVLTGGGGLLDQPSTASRVLLGS